MRDPLANDAAVFYQMADAETSESSLVAAVAAEGAAAGGIVAAGAGRVEGVADDGEFVRG